MFTEQLFSNAGIITAYQEGDITFAHPVTITRRYLQSASDFSISGSASPIVVPIQKTEGASVKESPNTGTSGDTYTVTIEFNVSHPTQADLERLYQLRTAKTLVLTHFADQLTVVRSLSEGWIYEETLEDVLHVKLTIHNVSGVQRVI